MIGDFFHRTYKLFRCRAAGGPRPLVPSGHRGDSLRPADPSFVCEHLEPRLLLSSYAVTNPNDAGAGSLRQALVDANASAGLDMITFNIAGGSIHTIVLASALPDITDAVVIDATSQPGYAGTPLIELNGAGAGSNRAGLTLESGSGGSTIRGLAINRFGGDGIHITRSSENLIEHNFIGTDPTGTIARGNGGDGIEIYFNAADNVIRDNVISANVWGISIGIGSTDDDSNVIQANKIGTDLTGTLALGNTSAGITAGFGSVNTLIGGSAAGQANVIAFNGIGIEFRQNAGAGHTILGNSIFANGSLGIDLGSDGVTTNDAGDGDAGPNNRQNFPVLISAQAISSTQVTIVGSLNSTANSYFRVEFFAGATADGSGYGQGQRYLGFANVATDGAGNAVINVTLTATVAPGDFLTATATRTDSTFSMFTDSSEFAQNVVVANSLVHTPSVTDATTNEDTQTTSGLVISRNAADGAEVTHFKITGIANGTLYQNDGTTPIAEGSFITVAEGNAGLKFTPAADFNGSGHFTVQASTSDNDAGLGGGTATATITVNAVNDAPVVSDQSFSVEENAANGTPVGTVAASDPDAGDHLSYAITAGNTGGAFAINSTTGEITAVNPAALDYETHPTFSLTVEVTDSGIPARTASATVTIHLVDRNEAPVVNDQSFFVAENAANGTSVGTVAARDPDVGDHLTYAITAGNTGGAFALNRTTGEITVANPAALDYEVHPTFSLNVEVTDSGIPARTASATVTIHLVDRNEAPVVNNQSFWVDENAANGTVVGTVIASDVDAGDRLTYSITAGNTGGAFALDRTTGAITVANPAALDYETTPTFHVTVQITDTGGWAAEATVTIDLHSVNEAPLVLVPGALFTPGTAPLVFRSAAGTGISIRDVDAGAGSVQMTIQVAHGSVTLAGTAGLTFVHGDGVDDAALIFTGTVAAVNAALEGMTFKSQLGYIGVATLQLAVDDQGHSGSGGHLLDAAVVDILIGAVPPPPAGPGVPAPPEPDSPEPELPEPKIGEPEVPGPEPEDPGEGPSESIVLPVSVEAPVVADAATVANVLRRQGARGEVMEAGKPVSPAQTPTETRPADSDEPPVDGNTNREDTSKPQEHGQEHADVNAESAAIAVSVHANTAMWSQVASMKGQMDRAAGMQQRQATMVVGMATGVSMSFAAGYVIWLLRGGSLLASLLAATPLWKSFDPLPVLASWEKREKQRRRRGEKDEFHGDEEHELDGLFGSSVDTAPEGSGRVME